VTTHDLALTQIADQLGPLARNVHFADDLVNGALHFDYKLRSGVVEHSNALALMRAVGLSIDVPKGPPSDLKTSPSRHRR
jgi:DNA mismatch repair ATPase MutS